jgi:hypothetical protein
MTAWRLRWVAWSPNNNPGFAVSQPSCLTASRSPSLGMSRYVMRAAEHDGHRKQQIDRDDDR